MRWKQEGSTGNFWPMLRERRSTLCLCSGPFLYAQ